MRVHALHVRGLHVCACALVCMCVCEFMLWHMWGGLSSTMGSRDQA